MPLFNLCRRKVARLHINYFAIYPIVYGSTLHQHQDRINEMRSRLILNCNYIVLERLHIRRLSSAACTTVKFIKEIEARLLRAAPRPPRPTRTVKSAIELQTHVNKPNDLFWKFMSVVGGLFDTIKITVL
ncbi:unnamed protein product [Colias eurytheme]|nr:unnamed protein product [Colias eurytheme]